jgi:hypothetical protein
MNRFVLVDHIMRNKRCLVQMLKLGPECELEILE